MANSSSASAPPPQAPSSEPESIDPHVLFADGIDLSTANATLIKKYVTHCFQGYIDRDFQDYALWEAIQVDFEKFEAKHWDKLDGNTWSWIRPHCYTHGFWTDHNFGVGRSRATTMAKAVAADFQDWTADQIKWVEKTYRNPPLSPATILSKVELNMPFAGNQAALKPVSSNQVASSQAPAAAALTPTNPGLDQHGLAQPGLAQPGLAQSGFESFTNANSRAQSADPQTQPQQDNTPNPLGAQNQSWNNQFSRELVLLDKIYKEEDKFGGTGDNFDFKVTVYYDKCRRAGLPPHAYILGASIMLTGQAQTRFYANRIGSSTFERFCYDMRQFFEGAEWQRFNLTKWQTITFAGVISNNPTLSTTECLRKMCTELDTIQRGLDPAYHGPVHLRENIIRACRGHPALANGLTNPPTDAASLVNMLYTSIINYETIHSSSSPAQQNYTTQLCDEDPADVYFTDRQYRSRFNPRPSQSSDTRKPFQGRKRCFVCGKEGCWSTNHLQHERDNSKKRFTDQHPKYKGCSGYNRRLQQYITEYEGDSNEDEVDQFFEELLIDAPPITSEPDTKSVESFFTSWGELCSAECMTTANMLTDNVLKHQITFKDDTFTPAEPVPYERSLYLLSWVVR